jgi:hypothetical protein
MAAEPITRYILSEHAEFEMDRRGLDAKLIATVLGKPDQRRLVRPGREVLQSKVELGEPAKTYLVRVFIDVDRTPAEVVTVYRTSRIARYWQEEP